MDIDLSDYVAGGYFVVKYSSQDFWKSNLMPERVISLSGCVSPQLEIVWGWNTEKYQKDISDFGIPSDKFDTFAQWCRRDPGALYSLDIGREFVAAFLPDNGDYFLIGIALPKGLVDGFLINNQQTVFDTNQQVYKDAIYGVNYVLKEHQPLPQGGTVLGFEVLSYSYGNIGCSWLCSGIEKDMHELFGIHPNLYGLIDSYTDAKKVYDWIAEDEMQGIRAEPEPYYPWLIVQYPVS
ncbi:MAG: hypothetical protein ABI690_24210 [Chloroflexota bacterium]